MDDDVEAQGCFKPTNKKGQKSILVEFRDFILGGNLIRMAVAFVLALALENLISQFVASFITPIIGIIGARDFSELTFTIRDSRFAYGNFLDSGISFIVICLVLFFFLILPTQRLAPKCAPAWVIRKCPYCLSDMSAMASKCAFCCSDLEIATSPSKAT